MKLFDKYIKLNEKSALILIIVSAFLSSFSFAISQIVLAAGYSGNAGYIASSIEFWLFLILEIILLIRFREKPVSNAQSTVEIHKKILAASLILFFILLLIFIMVLLVKSGGKAVIEMILFSLTVFSFHLIFIVKSNLFKNILRKRKEKIQ